MAEPITYYDLDYNYTHGDPLYVTVQEGKDAIQDIGYCTHCGRSAMTKVTLVEEDSETTLTIHHDKLNGVRSTKRIEQPKTDINGVLMEGD